MPDVIVIGDGPGGLSAALFLAKNGSDVVVFGQNNTAMNWALLRNYLGIPEIAGTEFQKVARAQAIISAGDGAAAAIDILSREKGDDVVDWDEPPKA